MSAFDTYRVWCPDHDQTKEDGRNFTATSHSDAAERWAEYDDQYSVEFEIIGGAPATVHVALPGKSARVYVVSGKSVPEYSAVYRQ